jgi:hypothetical protein
MDDSGYPLAQADRAFAYDGAYRTPFAMSAAARAAYGLHGRPLREASGSFRHALQCATAGPIRDGTIFITRREGRLPASHLRSASGTTRIAVPQRDAVLCARARTTFRLVAPHPRPSSVYYLFASSAGCIVRAIVWQGRVFSGGARTCPKSKP